ncbi:MAG: STELLO glycosyltransferase family protein [Chthoniobacteraceae bacterium]|nr:STELLO glycosyltransferase family protein [Chthoniobacteraceae bacterium]
MNPAKTALVVTTVSAPNPVLKALAQGAAERNIRFIAIGDAKSPADFSLEGCEYYSLEAQRSLGLSFADACPERHYARKNIGYLLALQGGAEVILETDDDNFPREAFWNPRGRAVHAAAVEQAGWVNAYHYFTEARIWPRGLPLDAVQATPPAYETLPLQTLDCPIQQGLADENPDVDALYRLLLPLPQNFRADRRVAFKTGTWCPFNSQNTTWWRDAFPLLYLPAFCSFRMTDIWRSFVAQRLAWANGWSLLFHEPTVYQERNEHDLMRDFQDEIPGYLHNRALCETLAGLDPEPGPQALGDNLRLAYAALADKGFIGKEELPLLEAWLADLRRICLG